MPIRSQTVRLARQLRAAVGGQADAATRGLTAAWVAAWAALGTEMDVAVREVIALAGRLGRWPAAYELNRIDRLQQAMGSAERSLTDLSTQTVSTVIDAANAAIRATIAAEPAIAASQFPAPQRDAAAGRYAGNINPSAVDVIIARTSQQITSSTLPLSAEATEVMNRRLVRGVELGINPRDSAARMIAELQDGFNGGLTRAVNIARTEVLDAYRGASQYAHQSNSDVLGGWIWLATLSSRTCPSCLAMNGSEHPLSEPGPLDHQSGRCTRMPQVRPWADLGIDIPEPESIIPDAREWFAGQPEAVRRRIMGNRRLQLLQSDRINWDDIPLRRESTEWRPSYVPRSARDLDAIARQRAGDQPRPVEPIATPLPQRIPSAPQPHVEVPAEPGRMSAADMVAPNWAAADASSDAIKKSYAAVLDGTYAGLTVHTDFVSVESGVTIANGSILDANGFGVGLFARGLSREDDGTLVATHALLTIRQDLQGQGFSDAFNNHLEDWYRESGVDHIELTANISIGGYAWARSGYDFKDDREAEHVLELLSGQVVSYESMAQDLRNDIAASPSTDLTERLDRIQSQLLAARDILRDAGTYPFGSLEYPSAYRISQAGRWDGATRDDLWIGKEAMLGSYWEAVKPL